MNLAVRVVILTLLLVAEKFLLNVFVDFGAAQGARGVGELAREIQHWAFRFIVTFAAVLATTSLGRLWAYAAAGAAAASLAMLIEAS
jgi:hypothetical protein